MSVTHARSGASTSNCRAFLERTLLDAEHVRVLTAQDATDGLAAMSGMLDDLLDRHTLFRQFQNGLVCFLTTPIPFILQAFRIGEKLWIYDCAADGLSDLPHGLADRIKESAAAERLVHECRVYGILLIPEGFERELLGGRQSPIAIYADASYFLMYQKALTGIASPARTTGV